MYTQLLQINTTTIVFTTLLQLGIGGLLVFFLLYYQRKRFRHQNELLELKEAFNQNLMQSKLEIQEQTLNHISRELHDNISPLISIIQLNLGASILRKTPEIQPEISELKVNANQLMAELKSLSVTLNTDHIMHIGFSEALWFELDRLERTKIFKTIRTVTGEKFRLRAEHEIILFRMCQEILNNIVKHAQAKTITVELDYLPGAYRLTITDDGTGFDPSTVEGSAGSKNSTGLRNIQNRARLINAAVLINSSPGKGTQTNITIQTNT
jgi:signal transduction histidine kinase